MISVKGESAGLREVAAAAEAWGKSIAIVKCAVCKNKKV